MPKKVLLDVDPGVVDAFVICAAMYDPAVEIVAITSVGGSVPASVAAKNLQAVIEFIDPSRLPRIGMGGVADIDLPLDFGTLHGVDGLGGVQLPVAELRTQHPAEKVICDTIRNDPENVMVICMGPLTNIARAFARDPSLPGLVRHLYITGGSVAAKGNITPCAEFNFYADPAAAKTVLNAPCTKTIVPLDVTERLIFTLDDLDKLPDDENQLGKFYKNMSLPFFRSYRQKFGIEGIHIHDLISYMLATRPEYAITDEMACDVETIGQITRGMTVFDQRDKPEWNNNTEVVKTLKNEDEIIPNITTLLTAAANINAKKYSKENKEK
ncbi:MAG: nucleoside hydrolase [Planctomycetaceae bacterium]|nr:nucleoside hydrolase [Planctomycetaceae bacterium]